MADIDTNGLLTGVVKWFNDEKGYGFIVPDPDQGWKGKEIFVHFTGIMGEGHLTLNTGERVEFILGSNSKGVCAEGVRRI